MSQQGFLNVFLERRRVGRGAVNLEDDHLPEQDLHLLTQSQTSTSSPRARPPPPVRSLPEQLKGEAERLGTGGLWCQLPGLDRRLRLETRGLQHRTRGSRADGGAVLKALGWWRSWWRACLVNDVCRGNVFLERRRVGRGAVNLEDDHHPEPDLHLLTQSQTSTSCQKSSRTGLDRRLRLETRGLQHRTRGSRAEGPGLVEELVEELVEGLPGIGQQGFLNVFLERRRVGRGAVNLEDASSPRARPPPPHKCALSGHSGLGRHT
ncbi:unnamed protein product [Boreogadus saida]